jgi:L-amino acid N-acyltransferase YncA
MQIKLIKASLTNLDFFYEVRNHPDNRVFATIPNSTISYEDHCKWFAEKIEDETNLFYVISYNGEDAGYIRVDGENEVSIALHPSWQGKGLGSGSLNELCQSLAARTMFNEKPLRATILKTNKISMNAFLKAGFQHHSESTLTVTLQRKI